MGPADVPRLRRVSAECHDLRVAMLVALDVDIRTLVLLELVSRAKQIGNPIPD